MIGSVAIWLCALLTPTAADDPASVSFHLRIVSGSPPLLEVSVTAQGEASGETVFRMQPYWAAALDLPAAVVHVEASSVEGDSLSVERLQANRWAVKHPASASLQFTYRLRSTQENIGAEPSSYYQFLLNHDLLHFIGETAFLYPERLDSLDEVTVAVDFEQDPHWRIVSSFGASPEGFRRTLPITELRSSVFVGGNVRFRSEPLGDSRVGFAFYGDWNFEDGLMIDLAMEIIEAERAFFQDEGPPFFLISMIPVGSPRGSMSGTALTNSFALFLSPEEEFREGERTAINRLLAHELFHHWNGHTITKTQPETLVYWFSEGFTDFFARKILYEAGIFSDEEYLREWNRTLRDFWLSPYRNLSNQDLKESFWKNSRARRIPYLRGDCLALCIDIEIKKQSDGDESIDDVMRELLARARTEEPSFDTERLLSVIEEFTSAEFVAKLSEMIEGNKMPLPEERALAPLAHLEWKDLTPFELGFDFQASREKNIVRGVDPKGAAYRAGLRDGQRVRGWSIRWDQSDEPVSVYIESDDGRREIRYLPIGEETVPVPRFVSS